MCVQPNASARNSADASTNAIAHTSAHCFSYSLAHIEVSLSRCEMRLCLMGKA
jgi:hypothetical protein